MNVIVPILLTLLFAVIGYISGNFLYAYIIGKKVCHIDLYKIGSGNPGSTNLARGTKNKKIVLCAFLCDVFKCYLPILISALIYRFVSKYSGVNLDCAYIIYLAGFFAIIGHCFPLIHIYSLIRYGKDNEITKHNKGGRGVATFVGFMFAYNPWLWVVAFVIWYSTKKFGKMVSLASILAASTVALFGLIPGFSNCLYMYQVATYPSLSCPVWTSYVVVRGDTLSFYSNYRFWIIFAISFCTGLLIVLRHAENLKRIFTGTEYKFNKKK